jgi:serine O-acetyltransferase
MNAPDVRITAQRVPDVPWEVGNVVADLRRIRERWRESQQRNPERSEREFPCRDALRKIIRGLCGALFPMRLGPTDLRQESEDSYIAQTLDIALTALLSQVRLELLYRARHDTNAGDIENQAVFIVQCFTAALPEVREMLDGDAEAAYEGDPAARSVDEVLLCYPGVLAIIHYRLAHRLFKLGTPLLARIIAEIAHSETGIDIHPGARIGRRFFIDHGTGVVIGETAEIGEGVRLYQAVTLGAKRFPIDGGGSLKKGLARHPIVEDNVVIYAGATILGRITIGCGSTIGGNVWLTRSVPPGSHLTQANSQHEVDPIRIVAVG